VDSLLISPNQEKDDDLFEVKKFGVPFVIVGRHIKEFESVGIPMAYIDEVDGGYRGRGYLIERGCKQIVFIGAQPYDMELIERCEGYKKALKGGGIGVDDRKIDGRYKSVMELESLNKRKEKEDYEKREICFLGVYRSGCDFKFECTSY
jgi:LacI family transcriptional regulator